MTEFKKEMIEIAKAEGLEIAEDACESLTEVAFKVIDMLIAKSENKYDDMVWMAVKGKAKEAALEAIDNINKADNK
tara:strand:+ start:2696 stop:2923 length:228 start_codon:yes stop_codon:yes gene_type:complete